MNAALQMFLIELRQHPLFPQFIEAVERPRIKPYRSGADKEQWIFESGQLKQHEAWLGLLTGTDPSDIGDKT